MSVLHLSWKVRLACVVEDSPAVRRQEWLIFCSFWKIIYVSLFQHKYTHTHTRVRHCCSADIVRDFQSQILQEEWNKFGMSVVRRRNERLQRLEAAAQAQQQQRQAHAAARQMRMAQVESSIDAMQAKFTDQSVALDYDADRLLKKYGFWTEQTYDDVEKESKPLPCLGPRAHWIDCQKKYGSDNRPCNFYVQALEECVRQTIGKSAMEE